jgi:hypothetical protein
MTDPTIEELRAMLIERCPDADEFDREQAIYWFSADFHGGQWSELYAALCASPYRPGAIEFLTVWGRIAMRCW